jgi:DNA-binding transcriptional regulator PaaX
MLQSKSNSFTLIAVANMVLFFGICLPRKLIPPQWLGAKALDVFCEYLTIFTEI